MSLASARFMIANGIVLSLQRGRDVALPARRLATLPESLVPGKGRVLRNLPHAKLEIELS